MTKSPALTTYNCPLLTFFDRMHDLDNQGLYSNPIHFYDFLQNRVLISFRPKVDAVDAEHPEFDLTLSKKMNYDVVRAFN